MSEITVQAANHHHKVKVQHLISKIEATTIQATAATKLN